MGQMRAEDLVDQGDTEIPACGEESCWGTFLEGRMVLRYLLVG